VVVPTGPDALTNTCVRVVAAPLTDTLTEADSPGRMDTTLGSALSSTSLSCTTTADEPHTPLIAASSLTVHTISRANDGMATPPTTPSRGAVTVTFCAVASSSTGPEPYRKSAPGIAGN
jgi:hypothetical protein